MPEQLDRELLHLSKLSLDVASIKTIQWELAAGVYITCKTSSSDEQSTFALIKNSPGYWEDVARLKEATNNSHLLHLSNLSIDVASIKIIQWSPAAGVYITCKTSIPDEQSSFALIKNSPGYWEDVAKLKKATNKTD